MNKLCVISMSGGLDSTTLAYKALNDGYKILPINIKYGQKNSVEETAFDEIIYQIKEDFPGKIIDTIHLNLEEMARTTFETYQKIRDSHVVKDKTEMEYYTPSRNLVFSTLAAMVGEIVALADNVSEIKIGLGIHQHTQYDRDYWDITPEFVKRLNYLFELNDCIKVSMYAPYADQTKADIVKDAVKMEVPIFLTWTCYNPIKEILEENPTQRMNFVEYLPCLKCEACVERQKAGDEADMPNINSYIQEGWERT